MNVLYTHADSSVSPDRSDGSMHMTMNGAFTSGSYSETTPGSSINDAPMLAEITECKYAADDVVTFRGFLENLASKLKSQVSLTKATNQQQR